MDRRILASSLCILSSVASMAFANPAPQANQLFTINGSIPYQIKTAMGLKTISLLNINPTPQMKKILQTAHVKQEEPDYSAGIIPFSESPGAVDLGMNNVPVLDQGQYGTCVTFSSTAILDAAVGKGDLIDQQCSLELDVIDPADNTDSQQQPDGNYWNGAYLSTQIINPLMKQGIIEKNKCFGAIYPNPGATLTSLDQYTAVSDKTTLSNTTINFHNPMTLDDLKTALKAGHRVVFSSLIGPSVVGYNTKINGVENTGGLWACQQSSLDKSNYCDGYYAGGHEIVAIGYDDAQQLIKIRNSWGTSVGDNGDYYMTYTYFTYWSENFYQSGSEVY